MQQLFASILLIFGDPSVSQTDSVRDPPPAAQFSAAELRERIAAAQRRIQSFYVVYRSDDYQDAQSRARGAYLRRIVAAKAPGSLLHVNAHGTRDIDWRLDPDAQRAIITSKRAVNVYD